MIRIIKANKCHRKEMANIFINCYSKYFNTDVKILNKIISNALVISKYYVCIDNDKVIGFSSYCNGETIFHFNKLLFWLLIGIKKGNKLYRYLKTLFEEKDYAFEIDKKCMIIDLLCLNKEYENTDLSYILINHLICDNDYVRILVKVGNNNTTMIKMLNEMNFEIFDEESSKSFEKELGISKYYYMIGEKQ